MLKYPRRTIDLVLDYPFAEREAAFYTANVRAKIRKGRIRECWISEAQLSRVRVELDYEWLEGEDLFARDIDGMQWTILVDRPRKR